MLVTFQRMNVVMSYLLIVCVLLLDGCAPAPKPTEIPLREGKVTIEPTTDEIYEELHREVGIAALQSTREANARTGAYDYAIGRSFYVYSKERPAARFHYKGGAWCNVWADDKGMYWEKCK